MNNRLTEVNGKLQEATSRSHELETQRNKHKEYNNYLSNEIQKNQAKINDLEELLAKMTQEKGVINQELSTCKHRTDELEHQNYEFKEK